MINESSDKYASRRLMPRVVIPNQIKEIKAPIVLVSGNLDYFVRYGIALINSFVNNGGNTCLVINCVDFTIGQARKITNKYFNSIGDENIIFTKTDLSSMGFLSLDQKMCYLKTIRFYVALKIREINNTDILITDIDALITKNSFSSKYQELLHDNVHYGVGATYDFLASSLYESRKQNYLWRTVKAGLTFFKSGEYGSQALKMIACSLFNFTDQIPPIDELKLYRAYYGDQLAILFTALELNTMDKVGSYNVKCLGCREGDIVSFTENPYAASIWIPPASKRDESLFNQNS